jgi:hypothetical protein
VSSALIIFFVFYRPLTYQFPSSAVVAFEELEKKYPEIMNSMTFAQLAAESRRKKALAEKTPLPSPPKVILICVS